MVFVSTPDHKTLTLNLNSSTTALHDPLFGGAQNTGGEDEEEKGLGNPKIADLKRKLKDMSLTNTETISDSKIAEDIKRARILMSTVTRTNPKHPPSWIASARVEEVDGKVDEARRLIRRGCEECPHSEEVWLEACHLSSPDEAKVVMAMGLSSIPKSVKLWVEAARLERGVVERSRVLREGLEQVPDSVGLWKALLELCSEEGCRCLLSGDVERCPLRVELSVAYARWESCDGAKKSCDIARETILNEPAIWVRTARFEEAHGDDTNKVGEIIERGVSAIQREGLVIDREAWMKEAEAAERGGFVATCQGIIRNTIGNGVEEEDRERTYVADAEECKKWGFVNTARTILRESHAASPNSEEIWLTAIKLEYNNHELMRAKMLLDKARGKGGKERVWMKSAILERELGNTAMEGMLLNEGVELFPSFFKLWLMLGQLEERLGHLQQAKGAYESGLKHCPNCIPLGLSLASLDEKMNGLIKARAILTMARNRNPQNPELWLAAIRAECKHGNKIEADVLMSRALQECPDSGILWAQFIEMVPIPQRKIMSMDALKKCDQDPYVIAAVANLIWERDGKVDKARRWLEMAVTLAPDVGDFWALYYNFELQHGGEKNQKDVMRRCIAAEPKHGEKWQVISKAVENSHQPTEAILKKVVVALTAVES